MRVTVDGVGLEVHQLDGAGPALVWLHEGLGSVALWKDVPSRVHAATGRRTIVYSRRGHGGSDPIAEPRTPTFMHHEADVVLPALLDVLAVDEAILIGHSDGASIALLAAGRGEPRVKAQVLMAPHVFVEDMSIASIQLARERADTTDLLRRLGRYHDDARHAFDAWADIWLAPAFREWRITDRVPGVCGPTLLIQGVDDEYGSAAQVHAIQAEASGPTDLLLLGRCGHSPHRDRPGVVLPAIEAFVDRVSG